MYSSCLLVIITQQDWAPKPYEECSTWLCLPLNCLCNSLFRLQTHTVDVAHMLLSIKKPGIQRDHTYLPKLFYPISKAESECQH